MNSSVYTAFRVRDANGAMRYVGRGSTPRERTQRRKSDDVIQVGADTPGQLRLAFYPRSLLAVKWEWPDAVTLAGVGVASLSRR